MEGNRLDGMGRLTGKEQGTAGKTVDDLLGPGLTLEGGAQKEQ